MLLQLFIYFVLRESPILTLKHAKYKRLLIRWNKKKSDNLKYHPTVLNPWIINLVKFYDNYLSETDVGNRYLCPTVLLKYSRDIVISGLYVYKDNGTTMSWYQWYLYSVKLMLILYVYEGMLNYFMNILIL